MLVVVALQNKETSQQSRCSVNEGKSVYCKGKGDILLNECTLGVLMTFTAFLPVSII